MRLKSGKVVINRQDFLLRICLRTNGVTTNIRNIDLLGLPIFNINDREEMKLFLSLLYNKRSC